MATLTTTKSAIFMTATGTLPVPPAGYIEASEAVIVNPEHTPIENKRLTGKLGQIEVCKDPNYVKTSFTINHIMRSNNIAADALETLPGFDTLLKLGGMEVAVDTGTPGQETVTYTNTQNPPIGSCIAYNDGFKQEMTNALVGNVTMSFTVGENATMEFAGQAFLDNRGIAVAEATPSVTLSSEKCLVVSSVDLMTAGGTTIPFDSCTIDMGAEIEEYYTTGQVAALKNFQINDYMPKITATFFEDSANYIAAQTAIANETNVAIVINIGTNSDTGALQSGKSIRITAPVAHYMNLSDSEDKQKIKRELEFACLPDGSNVNLKMELGYFA